MELFGRDVPSLHKNPAMFSPLSFIPPSALYFPCLMLLRGSLAALVAALVSSVAALSPGFPYGSQKVRGVNLGGWLVL